MRWFIAALAALLLCWGVYIVSPYWALRNLAVAIERGDEGEIARRVNVRALRHTLARQIVSDLSSSDRAGALSTPDVQLAAGALVAAAEPLLENLLTARGISNLLRPPLRDAAPSGEPGRAPSDWARARRRLVALLQATQWRGFRSVYFNLPPDEPRDRRFRVQLRLSRMTWRLVGLELPAETRQQIAARILQAQRSRSRP